MQNIFENNNSDPHDNFLNTNQFSDTNYFTMEEMKSTLFCSNDTSFPIIHVNIVSLKKNFDNLVNFLTTLGFNFKSSVFLKYGVLMIIIIGILLSDLITATFTKKEALVKLLVV